MNKIIFCLIGFVGWLFSSCTSKPEYVTKADRLPDIYPDYIGVTIPSDIAPLNFNMVDENIDCVDVVAHGSKGGELHVCGEWANFDVAEWQRLTKQNQGGKITMTICVEKNDN